ncbi:reverse transcriptase domain-containing protein [Tanacetum coccineum]
MMSQTRSKRGRENSAQPHLVFTNDDLLTEILIRLPILYIHLFTTVSKQWLQILTSPYFTDRRRKIPNLDPPAGIFSNHLRSLFECDFVSLDSRLNSKKSTMDHSFGSAEEVDHVRILQSCNGFLLIGVFRLAFDPRKSSHYKVVQAGGEAGETWIQIYSSETGNWSFCRDRFSYFSFDHFESAIYWNDVFHWLEGLNRELKHCKLNMEDHDHPIMTSLEIAHGLHRGRNFLESFGGPINDPILLLMEIPHMLHLEGNFFESCGCLLLVCRDDIGSTEFTIYEMMKGSSMWSVRYLVNIMQLLNPLPEG